MIAAESKESFEGDLKRSKALQRVSQLLYYSGIRYRRWSGPNETPIQLLPKPCLRPWQKEGANSKKSIS